MNGQLLSHNCSLIRKEKKIPTAPKGKLSVKLTLLKPYMSMKIVCDVLYFVEHTLKLNCSNSVVAIRSPLFNFFLRSFRSPLFQVGKKSEKPFSFLLTLSPFEILKQWKSRKKINHGFSKLFSAYSKVYLSEQPVIRYSH